MQVMAEKEPNISELYGQNEGLSTYRMARSLDGRSGRDITIGELARDAVSTSLRQDRDEFGLDPSRINVDEATSALVAVIEMETIGYSTTF